MNRGPEPINVLYFPGLGGDNNTFQERVVEQWSHYGFNVIYVPLDWGDGVEYRIKQDEINATVDGLHDKKQRVALVGSSAGASVVLNTLIENSNSVSAAVYICGKVNNINTKSLDRRLRQNPDFRESLDRLENNKPQVTSELKKRILSLRPRYDGVVHIADTKLEGVKEIVMPTTGHIFSIGCGLTFGSLAIARFIKQKAQ